MLTLYHTPHTRSARFIWLLEELGAPYEIKLVTIRTRDGKGARDPVNPHPHGKVPAINHDGVVVFESPAIALYLTDAFPKNGIGPVVGDAKRGAYLSWLAYYGGVMEPAFVSKFMNVEVPRGTAGWVNADEAAEFVAETLAEGPYLLGDKFSAADILFGSTFAMFMKSPLLPGPERFKDYIDRLAARPAYQRALAEDNG
ncbi:MAG: glutathione S-transferase family protein [Alphaproteobacteria bacterium]|nr:glutathione S-transferase family protein [Alphaproteobacteria bacterium]MDE2163995.1 glutathione S-transferase family protein [Alphaproteobacteria bacterium]MDE2500579.1 glutathione S-transferase family protein [Alphaproteobacteria bacterium]